METCAQICNDVHYLPGVFSSNTPLCDRWMSKSIRPWTSSRRNKTPQNDKRQLKMT